MIISSSTPADLINRAFLDASSPLETVKFADHRHTEEQMTAFRIAIDGAVLAGISAFNLISTHETAWHTAVFQAEIEHDETAEQAILDRYRSWLVGCDGLLQPIGLLEQLGFSVEGVVALRSHRREVQALLTPDDEFFEGDGFDRLTAEAVAAHKGNQTIAFEEMGD